MKKIHVLFISISGNTRAFINDLTDYAATQQVEIDATEISEATPPQQENTPFFAFVPTYLDGGNGIDNGVKELMTDALGEYIEYGNNAAFCYGLIGSGNKNFNEQYCLTAKRYAEKFKAPFLADYELRGTSKDTERIYKILEREQQRLEA